MNIPEIIGNVVASMPSQPYYMYGHRLEIANRLLLKDKDKVSKYQKYPLIALRLPITETVFSDQVHDTNLNIAILAYTDKNYFASDRYENVIIPVLYPLYQEFLKTLMNSGYVMVSGFPEHDKIDRLFYGVDALNSNERYIFNDPLDGIELINLNLKFINNNC